MKILSFLIPIMLLINNESKKQIPQILTDPANLRAHVDSLTRVYPARNYLNTVSLDQAAEYIFNEFSKYTTRVSYQTYQVDSIANINVLASSVSRVKNKNATIATREYRNVIASFGPEDGERLIIGAHYDVCGDQPGADDNASGVAGLLELARLIHALNPDLKYRVDLVAYSLEEPPYFRSQWMGSAIHAKSLKDSNIAVKAMISLEMIGYFSEVEDSQDFPFPLLNWFYPSTGNFITVVANFSNFSLAGRFKSLMKEVSEVPAHAFRAPSWIPGIDLSDHANYWKYGFAALMITDTAYNRNRNYHNNGDTGETLNYDKMAEVVKGVYWAMLNL